MRAGRVAFARTGRKRLRHKRRRAQCPCRDTVCARWTLGAVPLGVATSRDLPARLRVRFHFALLRRQLRREVQRHYAPAIPPLLQSLDPARDPSICGGNAHDPARAKNRARNRGEIDLSPAHRPRGLSSPRHGASPARRAELTTAAFRPKAATGGRGVAAFRVAAVPGLVL